MMRRLALQAFPTALALLFLVPIDLKNAAVVSLQQPFAASRTQRDGSIETGPCSRRTELYSEFKIVSKRPSRLVRDPKTGFYRPERKIFDEKPVAEKGPGLWNSFKAVVFTSVDGVASLPDKVRKLRNRNEVDSSTVFDGYRQVQQRIYESGGSPGKKLLKEYEQRNLGPNLSADADDKPNIFDSLKDGIYRSAEIASRLRPTPTDDDVGLDTFKPVVKSSIAGSPDVQASLQSLLQTTNPVKKAISRARIEEWDRKEANVAVEIERYRKSRQVREVIYSAGDAIQGAALALADVPNQASSIVDKIAAFLRSLPPAFQQTVESIQAIPTQVEKTSNEVQKSIEQSIVTTQKVVQDVQAIPEKVQRTAVATKDTALAIAGAVEGAATRGKVLLGLEKPLPRPPDSPPPPSEWNMKEVGWKVAGGVASGAWWVTKGVAQLSWKGASFAVQKGVSAFMEKNQQAVQDPPKNALQEPSAAATTTPKPVPPAPPASSSTKSTSKPDVTLSKVVPFFNKAARVPLGATAAVQTIKKKEEDVSSSSSSAKPERRALDDVAARNEDLDQQVEEALKLAEEALRMVEKEDL